MIAANTTSNAYVTSLRFQNTMSSSEIYISKSTVIPFPFPVSWYMLALSVL